MVKDDFRFKYIKRMVVMGESNAYGMSAGDPSNEWVQVLSSCIRKFQKAPIRVFNNSIPANVISPRAPGYDSKDLFGTSPSAIERYKDDMISYKPDLAVYAYGLNDSRCGHDVKSFIKDYEEIISETRKHLKESLIVLVGPYWNLQYDEELWRKKKKKIDFGKFSNFGDKLVKIYNLEISKLAKRCNAIFVNIYEFLEGAYWLLSDDACHFHDTGQYIIGQIIFITIATNSSFLSKDSIMNARKAGFTIYNTGGTNALPNSINKWRKIDEWKK
jgi:lysophospholipase L1-like esterase